MRLQQVVVWDRFKYSLCSIIIIINTTCLSGTWKLRSSVTANWNHVINLRMSWAILRIEKSPLLIIQDLKFALMTCDSRSRIWSDIGVTHHRRFKWWFFPLGYFCEIQPDVVFYILEVVWTVQCRPVPEQKACPKTSSLFELVHVSFH